MKNTMNMLVIAALSLGFANLAHASCPDKQIEATPEEVADAYVAGGGTLDPQQVVDATYDQDDSDKITESTVREDKTKGNDDGLVCYRLSKSENAILFVSDNQH